MKTKVDDVVCVIGRVLQMADIVVKIFESSDLTEHIGDIKCAIHELQKG